MQTHKKIPPHKNLYNGIIQLLHKIILEGEQADKTIEATFKAKKKWGKRDRGFVAETVYDCIRWKRKIEFVLNQEFSKRNSWSFVGTWLKMNGAQLPDLAEFEVIKKRKLTQKFPNASIEESIPDWLWEMGTAQMPTKQFVAEIKAMNIPAKVVLRVNLLRTTVADLKQTLEEEYSIYSEAHEDIPGCLILNKKYNVFRTDAFANGLFEVQDANSQKIGLFCDVNSKMRVIDCCAGAGGKTLHLAEQMENKGQLIAMDIYGWKLKELKRRAKRQGFSNIQPKVIEGSKTIKRMKASADLVLIDSPCSGLGVLKRNPNAKWRMTPERINAIQTEQKEIMNTYATLVKPGGSLVYATCSILPSENEQQVQGFLKANSNFKLVAEQFLSPAQTGFDGFYMARMQNCDL